MQKMILIVLLLVTMVSPVFGDGGCPERPANQQELAAFQSAYSAAKAALPPAPKDWVMKDDTEAGLGTSVPKCPKSSNDTPIFYWLKFKYAYSDEASDRADQNAFNDAMKGTPEQQAKLAELDRKIEALENAKKEARKNNDSAEKNRIKEEVSAAKGERSKIKTEISNAYVQRAMSGQLSQDMDKTKPGRKDAELIIKVNENHAWIPVRDKPVSIAGASQAYWCKGDKNGGRLVILLGAWDKNFKSDLARTSVVTKAQNIIIEINADQQMAETLARQIKLDLLKKQL